MFPDQRLVIIQGTLLQWEVRGIFKMSVLGQFCLPYGMFVRRKEVGLESWLVKHFKECTRRHWNIVKQITQLRDAVSNPPLTS